VVDAVRPSDLEAVARAISRLGQSVLPVGSAGLAAAIMTARAYSPSDLLTGQPRARTPGGKIGRVIARTAPILVVSGSPNPTTLEQIRHLGATARLVLLDVKQLLLTDASHEDWDLHQELAIAARQAMQGLLAGRDVIVTTALSADQVAHDQELGRDLGIARGHVGERLAHALGALARHLCGQATLGGLVAAGGETASAVCQALPGERLEIVEEVLPAIPLARVVGRPLRMVTKSGGFGSPEALRLIVEYLRQTEEVA
jgi:uncharacterized protein YgbK (DUF1537 family)